MPDIPGRPVVRGDRGGASRGGSSQMEVTWNAVLPNNTGSLLYLVERRSHSGLARHRQHDDAETSPWQLIEQVTSVDDLPTVTVDLLFSALSQTFIHRSKTVTYNRREESNKKEKSTHQPTQPNMLLEIIQYKKRKST